MPLPLSNLTERNSNSQLNRNVYTSQIQGYDNRIASAFEISWFTYGEAAFKMNA